MHLTINPLFLKINSYFNIVLGFILPKLLIFLLGAGAGLFLIYHLVAIPYRYPLDYGEAPLIDQAIRLTNGENIYRSSLATPPYTISNYPPLYLVSLNPFVKYFPPGFWGGRLISTISALAAAIFIGLIIHSIVKDRLAGSIAGLLFISIPYVVGWSALARIDMLALAFSLAGLYMLAKRPITMTCLVSGAILLLAAIFTRQSYALAAPMAAFVWTLSQKSDKKVNLGWIKRIIHHSSFRQAVLLTILVGGIGLVLLLVINYLTRGGFYFNIVTANVNDFGIERLKWNLINLRNRIWPLLLLGGFSLFLIRQRWNPAWALCGVYLVGASISTLTIGKIGSNVNYFLELCAALSLAAGVVVAWSHKQKYHIIYIIVLLLLIFQTAKLIQTTMKESVRDLSHRRSFEMELHQLEIIVRDSNGPILADEYMGLLTLQGKPLVIQPFEVTQLAWAGIWDQTPLIQSINHQEYSLILIHYFPEYAVYKERWTAEMLGAINRYYIPTDSLAQTTVYRPIGYKSPKSACPSAKWLLPSIDTSGIEWKKGILTFYGRGNEGEIPVYAVADGLLTRLPEWTDTLMILHDDPLNLNKKVWTYYSGMAKMDGEESLILSDFPPGVREVPVKSGQILGYQGSWSGKPMWPIPVHLAFAVIPAAAGIATPPQIGNNTFDPSPYLNVLFDPGISYSQSLTCQK